MGDCRLLEEYDRIHEWEQRNSTTQVFFQLMKEKDGLKLGEGKVLEDDDRRR